MSDQAAGRDEALFDFRAQLEADRARGEVRDLAVYARRFPGFEREIEREYLRHASGPAADPDAPGEAPEPAERRVAHYRLLGLLGRGGQGAVYLAQDLRLGRKVALKLLAGLALFSVEARRRFQREAELASRLDHPGIATVYESGVDGELAYLAMRYIEGETLARRIALARERGLAGADFAARFPCAPASRAELERCLELFEEAARTLHVAHELGLIHRDVKPGNLMIAPGPRPVFLDFGLAREVLPAGEAITHTGDLLGTPGYMSPEQIDGRGAALDRRSDVYSLGVALYECLTLELPFQAPTLGQLYQSILLDPPRDPRTSNRSIPGDLSIVLETALEKPRDRRYVTALELAEDLRRVRLREPIRARPPGAWLRSVRWVQRHPARTVALMLLALLGGALAYGLVASARAAELQTAAADRTLSEGLLDLLAEAPRRGVHYDWAAFAESELALYRLHGLALDEADAPEELARRIEAIAARDAELGTALRDGLYRLAATFEDVEHGPRRDDARLPPDLAPSALESPAWSGTRARLAALLEQLEHDPWRREVWSVFLDSCRSRRDGFAALLAQPALADRPVTDLILLAELVYYVRRDASALRVYDLADARGSPSLGARYAIRLGRGMLRLRAGPLQDLDGARQDLEVARELRPRSAPTCLGLARVHQLRGDVERALAHATQAVEADPISASARKLQAQLLFDAARFEEAEQAARAAARLAALDPDVHGLLAQGRLQSGDLAGAFAAWGAAARLSSAPAAVWQSAGAALAQHGCSSERVRELAGAQGSVASERAALLLGWAQAAARLGELEAAGDALAQACELDPQDPALLLELGRVLAAACDFAGAARELERALRLDPRRRDVARELANARYHAGEPGLAHALLSELGVQAPDDVELAARDASLCYELGDDPQAIACARRALDHDPACRAALVVLVDASQRARRFPEAFAALAALLDLEPEDEGHAEAALNASQLGGLDPAACAERLGELCGRHCSSVTLAVLDGLFVAQQGRVDEARGRIADAAARDTARAFALAWLAHLEEQSGRWDSAESHARAALAREPASDLARVVLVRLLCRRGHYSSALENALQCLDAGTKRFVVWQLAHEAARATGRQEELLPRVTRALEQDPSRGELVRLSYRNLRDLGRLDEACRLLAERRRARPWDLPALECLARAEYDAGRWSAAADDFATLAELIGRQTGGAPPTALLENFATARLRERHAREGALPAGGERGLARARELYRWGAFAEAAREADEAGAEAGAPLALLAGARAAEEAWRAARGSAVEAGLALPGGRGGGEAAPRSTPEELAAAALERLERELERGPAESTLLEWLEQRDLVLLRQPPRGAAWEARAQGLFARVRDLLARSRAGPR